MSNHLPALKRAEVERAILAGESLSAIGDGFGVSRVTVFKIRKRMYAEGRLVGIALCGCGQPANHPNGCLERGAVKRLTKAHPIVSIGLREAVVAAFMEGLTIKQVMDRTGASQNLCNQTSAQLGASRPKAARAPRKPRSAQAAKPAVVAAPAAPLRLALGPVAGRPLPAAEAPSIDIEEAAVAAFLASRGATRCPTAAVAATMATVPAADIEALMKHNEENEARRREQRFGRGYTTPNHARKALLGRYR